MLVLQCGCLETHDKIGDREESKRKTHMGVRLLKMIKLCPILHHVLMLESCMKVSEVSHTNITFCVCMVHKQYKTIIYLTSK